MINKTFHLTIILAVCLGILTILLLKVFTFDFGKVYPTAPIGSTGMTGAQPTIGSTGATGVTLNYEEAVNSGGLRIDYEPIR